MKGVACLVDVSQVSPSRVPDSVCCGGRGGVSKLKEKAEDFGWRSTGRCPVLLVTKSAAGRETAGEAEIRVCTNRTCRRQGSLETLEIMSGIAPPHVSVKSCGCLGGCGSGPNLVLLPQQTFLSHCGTPARAARAMSDACGWGDLNSWTNSLAALALRKRAHHQFGLGKGKGKRKGKGKDPPTTNVSEAELLLSQAINLKPCGGIHVLYKDRSALRLVMGKMGKALEDAEEALALAPRYSEAYICHGDALMAMGQFDAAEKSYAMAVEFDPSIRRSESFKARIISLQGDTHFCRFALSSVCLAVERR